MPNVKLTFVQVTLSWLYPSILGIFQLLLTRNWPNFKGRFQKKFDFNFLEPDHVTQNFLTLNMLESKIFEPQIFLPKFDFFLRNFFWYSTFRPKVLWVVGWIVFGSQFFGPNFSLTKTTITTTTTTTLKVRHLF